MTGAVAAVAASRLRRRWRAIVLVGVVAALAGGVTTASFAGARRTATAYDRLVVASDFPDAFVQLIEPRPGFAEDISRLPAVERSVRAVYLVGRHREQRNQLLVPIQAAPEAVADPVVVRGRAADPTKVDEATLSEDFAEILGLDVGDVFPYQALTDAEFADLLRDRWAGTASGPQADLRIVGISRTPTDAVLDTFPTLTGTPAFYDAIARDARGAAGVWVHLRAGADPSSLAAEVAARRGAARTTRTA